MTEQTTEGRTTDRERAGRRPDADSHDHRRQVLYWRLLARLFDHEEQTTLEAASLAVVEDIGLPPALLDPQASVDSIVQRHPELAAEFDGLMVPRPDDRSGPDPAHGSDPGVPGPATGSLPGAEAGPVSGSVPEAGAAPVSGSAPEARAGGGGPEGRDRAAEVRRAALVSKVLLNVFS
ncbi:hypothetical protein ABTX79_37775, partial [Streptomyces sp. NPDC096153]